MGLPRTRCLIHGTADYLRLLRSHWLGILLLTMAGAAAAAAFTLQQPYVYAANSSGFVTSGTSTDPALASINDDLAKSRAASYVDLATSRSVANLVIEDLELNQDPSALIRDISVTQPADTVLIKITARSSSPEAAQRLADAWVRGLATRVQEIENPDEETRKGILSVEPVEDAALPTSPVSPRPVVNIGAGVLAGLLLGFAFAALRSRLDRRLRAPDLVEKKFAVPIVGRVPVSKAKKGQGGDFLLRFSASGDQEHWGSGEAFRKLRTNLAYMSVDDPPRVIVVTSPRPEDGKSTVAANLAVAIALSGQSVVLVDGDLRRPTAAQKLGLVEGAGLTDVLIRNATIEDVLQRHLDFPELRVLAAGSPPPNPSELLGSQAMQRVLTQLKTEAIVIIDAPPLLPVTDAAVLTRHSDGAIVVVSYGATLDVELRDSLEQLEAVQGTVLGVVFNWVPKRSSSYSGYYNDNYYARSRSKRKSPAPPTAKRAAVEELPPPSPSPPTRSRRRSKTRR